MTEQPDPAEQPDRAIGRYVLYEEIAAGGMATVHLAKQKGEVGFSRTVAIKRLHPEYARDPQFVSMFLDEARLASRVRHPNVVPTLDVVTTGNQLYLVMEYVQGVSLADLLDENADRDTRIPPKLVASIVSGALMGLHAAHEACDEDGQNLQIVHRDVSPSNVLVGIDGMPRVLDFGVAKAVGRMHNTRGNVVKGTLGYMAPEQFNHADIDRRADIYSAAVMLWETLCNQPLFDGPTEYAVIAKALFGDVPAPSSVDPSLAPFDETVMRGLDRKPENRFATAREMALALEECVGTASNAAVAEWLTSIAGPTLDERARVLASVEEGRGRRVSEIRAEMLDALDLDGSGLEVAPDTPPPSTDRTAARDNPVPAAVVEAAPASPWRRRRGGIAAALLLVPVVVGAALWSRTGDSVAESPQVLVNGAAGPGEQSERPTGLEATDSATAPPGDSAAVPAPSSSANSGGAASDSAAATSSPPPGPAQPRTAPVRPKSPYPRPVAKPGGTRPGSTRPGSTQPGRKKKPWETNTDRFGGG